MIKAEAENIVQRGQVTSRDTIFRGIRRCSIDLVTPGALLLHSLVAYEHWCHVQ